MWAHEGGGFGWDARPWLTSCDGLPDCDPNALRHTSIFFNTKWLGCIGAALIVALGCLHAALKRQAFRARSSKWRTIRHPHSEPSPSSPAFAAAVTTPPALQWHTSAGRGQPGSARGVRAPQQSPGPAAWPTSLLFGAKPQAARVAALGRQEPLPPPSKYGLDGAGWSSESDGEDGAVGSTTAAAMQHLLASPQLPAVLSRRGATLRDARRTQALLRSYARLRRLDPPGFAALWKAQASREIAGVEREPVGLARRAMAWGANRAAQYLALQHLAPIGIAWGSRACAWLAACMSGTHGTTLSLEVPSLAFEPWSSWLREQQILRLSCAALVLALPILLSAQRWGSLLTGTFSARRGDACPARRRALVGAEAVECAATQILLQAGAEHPAALACGLVVLAGWGGLGDWAAGVRLVRETRYDPTSSEAGIG